MSAPALATEAAAAGNYPANRFNARERKVLASVKEYLDAGLSSAQIADSAVTLAKLAAGVSPSHVVKFAGKHTTAGGSATEVKTVTGVAATDIVVVTLQTKGATPRTIITAAPTTNTITYLFSGDPSTDHIVAYTVLRAAA